MSPALRRAQPKDLERVYLQERSGLLRYLARSAGHDAALDLVQEVYLRAAASEQASRLINPAGFLYRIARNILIDRARAMRSRHEPLPLIEALDAPFPAEQELGIAAEDLQAACDRALASLSPKTQKVFIMNRFDGKGYREIHCELGISMATVEYHMMKALARFRVAVDEIE